MKQIITTLCAYVVAVFIAMTMITIIIVCYEHHELTSYAREQRQQLTDSITTLNDSLNIYRELFFESVD